MPLFSIITVCYNSDKTIGRTIRSILAQSVKDYEYIIVDGGSKDGTIDIIKQYEALFEGRMHWNSEPDKGIYNAMNKGIMRSVGKYVWLVNSDDFIVPNALSIIKKKIQDYNQDDYPIISGAVNSWDEKKQCVVSVEGKDAKRGLQCYRLDLNGFSHPATLIPLKIYQTFGLYDDRFVIEGDRDLFHRVYAKKVPFLYIPEILTNMSNDGISGNWNYKRFAITIKDGVLYFNKNYNSVFVRYPKFLLWFLLMIRLYLKKKILS